MLNDGTNFHSRSDCITNTRSLLQRILMEQKTSYQLDRYTSFSRSILTRVNSANVEQNGGLSTYSRGYDPVAILGSVRGIQLPSEVSETYLFVIHITHTYTRVSVNTNM